MKAAVFHGSEAGLTNEDIPVPQIGPDQVLVEYGPSFALVITPESVRVAELEREADTLTGALLRPAGGGAWRGLSLPPKNGSGRASLDRLRSLLVAPLKLPESAKRIIISPYRNQAYVPFCLLLRDREVAYIDSATTYALLEQDGGTPTQDVFAVGDPVYAASESRLPATRVEVDAVATEKALGAEATRDNVLRSVSRKRWRSVHFACHALIDPVLPKRSALALTPTDSDDGKLSVLDIFTVRIAADLVVLSACETGRGKMSDSAGVVGFTRAFLYAGAPRVVVSLWKVGDEATRALMVKFYELWNPNIGKRLPAITALKKAQEFVKSQEKWSDPYYWAAWQLWGLP